MGEPARKIEAAEAEFWLVDVASGKVYALHDGFKVGRAGGDLQILDGSVSSNHCVFHLSGKALEVEDLGSRNGTYVGGKKIEPKKRLGLLPGVEVEIGNQKFKVHSGGKPKERKTAVELASLCSQLEPDSIPAPHPSAWSGAAVPKGGGRPDGYVPKAPVAAIGEPVSLGRERPGLKQTSTQTRPMPAAKKPEEPKDGKSKIVFAVLLVLIVAAGAYYAVKAGFINVKPAAKASQAQ